MTRKRIIFCLGSNIDDRKYYLDSAVKKLQKNLNLTNPKTSSTLENKAMLLDNSPKEWDMDFYNIAFSADIEFDKFTPLEILRITQKIEIDLGKINRGKWAPREIDIDIVAIDDLRIDFTDTLHIPHLGLFERDFFLKTIKEIEPEILEKLSK
ncbi:MAG: 2-amino-4-hydroxy-6-hydroxymethyldihydropteridine diphosphokinase [Rickettsiales bacterium]|jgi:2-amino-4-hydroxy-6-hydroxymethyldihydropteridine diphosphokinase